MRVPYSSETNLIPITPQEQRTIKFRRGFEEYTILEVSRDEWEVEGWPVMFMMPEGATDEEIIEEASGEMGNIMLSEGIF